MVGLFIRSEVKREFLLLDFRLYRDDGLAVHARLGKRDLEVIQQKLRALLTPQTLELLSKTNTTYRLLTLTLHCI